MVYLLLCIIPCMYRVHMYIGMTCTCIYGRSDFKNMTAASINREAKKKTTKKRNKSAILNVQNEWVVLSMRLLTRHRDAEWLLYCLVQTCFYNPNSGPAVTRAGRSVIIPPWTMFCLSLWHPDFLVPSLSGYEDVRVDLLHIPSARAI